MTALSDAQIQSISERLIQAQVAGDADALAELIHSDYRGVNPDGSVVTKAEEIVNLVTSGFTDGKVTTDSLIRTPAGAVVVGTATFESTEGSLKFRFTDTISDGKLIASQAVLLN